MLCMSQVKATQRKRLYEHTIKICHKMNVIGDYTYHGTTHTFDTYW